MVFLYLVTGEGTMILFYFLYEPVTLYSVSPFREKSIRRTGEGVDPELCS